MTRLFVLLLALTTAGAAPQVPPSMRQASTLDTDLIVATRDDDTLRFWTEWRPGATLETVTELRPDTPAVAIVRVTGCMVVDGRCDVNVDYVVTRPDGSVYREAKLLPVDGGKVAPPLRFTMSASDPPGLYRVTATIRDLNARRVQRPERIFSLRVER